MQSGYGVSEIPQFMVDGICSPFFPVPAADIQNASQAPQKHHQHPSPPLPFFQQQPHHQQLPQYFPQFPQPHQLQQHLLPQQHQPPPTQQHDPPRFANFHHPIPITLQQFFQQPPPHQFHLFQGEQQRRFQQQQHHHFDLDHDSGPNNSTFPTRITGGDGGDEEGGGTVVVPFLRPAMNFRLAVNDDDDDALLQGDDDEGSEDRMQRWPPPAQPHLGTTQREEESVKEPFWRPLDIDYINRNNKRGKEQRPLEETTATTAKHFKESKEVTVVADVVDDAANNYKLFSELEAICKTTNNNQNPTGSSSALTGENPSATAAALELNDDVDVDVDLEEEAVDIDRGWSDTSTGEETPLKTSNDNATKPSCSGSRKTRRKRRRRRKNEEGKRQLNSIAAFFEGLVKLLMEHQEDLHRKFLEVLERRDQERMSKEEAWRQQEAAKSAREAKARAERQAVASAREAAIIIFLERITGVAINLPSRESSDATAIVAWDGSAAEEDNKGGPAVGMMNRNRWPKAEVEALIRVRSGLEARFQEPGLKGPLWEKVSAKMGYSKSAKRCKEKWENINKYYRKTKESNRKRPQHSKTCPYFHQLDQLYSRSNNAGSTSISTAPAPPALMDRKDESDLLDTILVQTEQDLFNPVSLRFNSKVDENMNALDAPSTRPTAGLNVDQLEKHQQDEDEEDDGEEEEEEEEEEGVGESQGIISAATSQMQLRSIA